jgi:hypothetical protein
MPLSEKKDIFLTAKVKIGACLTAVSKLALNRHANNGTGTKKK